MAVAPPRPKMPPLNALKAFEAAARLNSFSAAADELCVTPAAVAQQIKSLETWTGKKLFKRNAKGVQLTPLGATVLPGFIAAFDTMASSVQTLRATANPLDIRIAATPSISQLWISPLLPCLRATIPDLSLSLTAMEEPPNLAREPFDLAIFFSSASDDCSNEILIGSDTIYPVCSPETAQKLRTLDDLASTTFLYDTAWKSDWETWLSHISEGKRLLKSGPEFSLYALALQECKNGAGVLIGHDLLVRQELKTGNLVAPFPATVALPKKLIIKTLHQLDPNSPLGTVVEFLKKSDPHAA
ncbi:MULTISPECIES: LysR substrate-binding domain-containing protein [unclassified Roseibium]|uniref:LysR substrate-binding domain-containing protein n=1 Tax=unclassified Roseibium TaxID=2629323 RepID=UPI00273E2EFE|nr:MULTISPECIES: LysR substrate-binding domain-containing protein [unclassified Roseibium]